MEEANVTQTYAKARLMPTGEKNICVRGPCRVRGTKVLANNDQGRLYASEGATIVGGVNDAARRCGGAG